MPLRAHGLSFASVPPPSGAVRNPVLCPQTLKLMRNVQLWICGIMIITSVIILSFNPSSGIAAAILAFSLLTIIVDYYESNAMSKSTLTLNIYMRIENLKFLVWFILFVAVAADLDKSAGSDWPFMLFTIPNLLVCFCQWLYGGVVFFPLCWKTLRQQQQQQTLPQHNPTSQTRQPVLPPYSATYQVQQPQTTTAQTQNRHQPQPSSIRQIFASSPATSTDSLSLSEPRLPQTPPPCRLSTASNDEDKYAFLRDL